MTKLVNRLFACLLALAMLLSLIPLAAVPARAATGYDRGYTGGMAGSGEYKAFGLDVSSWQGINLDFNRIKNAGYDYVILRAGTSKGKDTCFETYYANAKAAGLDVGAYYYSYATSVAAVQVDMNAFISYIAGKKFEYPIYFDYEDLTQQALSPSLSQEICLTAMDMLAAEGYLVGMYTGKYFSTKLPMDVICAKYEVWIAHYLASGDGSYNGTGDYWKYGPTYASQYGMYQFTDSVWIDGYGPFDGDVCYKDYPSIVKTYGFNGYDFGKNPEGYLDEVTVVGPGKIRVRGWTLDEDELGTSIPVHIYIGGGPGDPNAEGHVITANQPRDDIAAAYPWAGNAHGFDVVINTGKSGWQVVNVYGINVGRGDNTLLNGSGCIADIPLDTEQPTISNVQISNLTATGYTVTCTVSDNVAIRNVTMPTWSEAWNQDDIVWGEAALIGNQATYNVSFSSHNFEYGTYNTHIYAYDLAGNCTSIPLLIEVPPALADKPTSGVVAENTYFISSVMNKNFVLDVENWSTDNWANVQLYYTLGSSANQRWRISDPDGDGYYTIVCENSGKALEAAGGGTTDGTNVQQYELNGTDSQLWKLEHVGEGLYRIVNKNNGLVLDLKDGVVATGQNVQLYSANDSWAQLWYLTPADLAAPEITDVQFSEVTSEGFRVTCTVSDISGVEKVEIPVWTNYNGQDDLKWHVATVTGNTATCYISIADHNYEPGSYDVHIYAYDRAGNSQYITTGGGVVVPNRIGNAPVSGKLEGGTYFITTSQNQNFVVDVSGASTDNGANIQLWETLGFNRNQMWQISDPDGDGYYTVVALHSGKFMDVEGGYAINDTNVQQFENTDSDAQLWQIVANDDGTYSFYSKCGGFALDLFYGWVFNGVNIRIHDANGAPAQKWYLIPADVSGPEITDVQFSEVTSEGFRVTCTVSDPNGIQKVEFPAWTKLNGQDDSIWHSATISGNTASCYISIAEHNMEPGDYELHIYTYDYAGNCTGIVTTGVTVPNRIGNAPVSGKLEGGTYFITSSQNQNFVVDVSAAAIENGANIQLWDTLGFNLNQMWKISDPDGDGYYTVVNVNSGKYMDVAGGVAASDTNVQQFENTDSDAQLWQIVANDDGTYSFYSKCGGFALDLFFGWVANGANIQIHEANDSAAQRWYLIPAKLSADTDHIHTYASVIVIEPTCADAGCTVYTCANCGDSYTSDYVEALEHTWTDATCTAAKTCSVCGETEGEALGHEEVTYSFADNTHVFTCTTCGQVAFTKAAASSAEKFGLKGASPVLSDDIVMVYETYIPAGFENAYMVFEFNGTTTTVTESTYNASNGRTNFRFPGLNPQKMGDNIHATLYATVDGYEVSIVNDYSMVQYCDRQLKSASTSAGLRTALSDLLVYGAMNQIYEGYKTDALCTTLLSANAVMTPSTFPGVDASWNVQGMSGTKLEDCTFTGVDVTLGAKIVIGVKVTCVDTERFSFKVNIGGVDHVITGDMLEPTDVANKYVLKFDKITAVQLGETITFSIWEGDTQVSRSATYSVYSYIYKNQNAADTNLANLLHAIYNYGEAVKKIG